MLIKERQYKNVVKEVREIVSHEVFGCDSCRKEIDLNKPEADYLEATVFNHSENTESDRKIFCSWKCVIKKLRTVKSDYFVSLPFLHYDEKPRRKGTSAKDFFKLLK